MISLSGTKNGILCETTLMKLENRFCDDNEHGNSTIYGLWKFKLESEEVDEILSCTILKDGRDQLELDFIKGTISTKQLPPVSKIQCGTLLLLTSLAPLLLSLSLVKLHSE